MPAENPTPNRTEQWRPVADWPLYEVSDAGRVRRAAPGKRTAAGRLLGIRRRRVYLYAGAGHSRKLFAVARLVADAFPNQGPIWPPQGRPGNPLLGRMGGRRPPYGSMAEALDEKSEPVPFSGCRIYVGHATKSGYGRLAHAGVLVLAHRAAWELAHGPVPPGMSVCHHCDVRPCINVDHLFVGTNADNTADKVKKGRQRAPAGEAHGAAAVNREVVKVLRWAARNTGRSHLFLGKLHGIARSTVQGVVSGKTWRQPTTEAAERAPQ